MESEKARELFFRLLRCEIDEEYSLSETDKEALGQEALLTEVCRISKRYDLAHMVCDALERMELLCEGEKATEFLRRELMKAVFRSENQDAALRDVSGLFEKERLPFIPLKGAVLKRYYPQEWMRTGCDVDILVHPEDMERAIAALEGGGFAHLTDHDTPHDVTLSSASGVLIELHHDMIEENRAVNAPEVLQDIWRYAHPKAEGCFEMLLSGGMFYFYNLAHTVKHCERKGCGVRPFIDLVIINRRMEVDETEKKDLLSKGGLEKADVLCTALSEVWLCGKEHTRETKLFEDFLMLGDVYGSSESHLLISQAKQGNSRKYVLSRLWIPAAQLEKNYPQLKTRRWALPYYEAKRLFSLLTKRSGYMKKRISDSKKISDSQMSDTAELFGALGLLENRKK